MAGRQLVLACRFEKRQPPRLRKSDLAPPGHNWQKPKKGLRKQAPGCTNARPSRRPSELAAASRRGLQGPAEPRAPLSKDSRPSGRPPERVAASRQGLHGPASQARCSRRTPAPAEPSAPRSEDTRPSRRPPALAVGCPFARPKRRPPALAVASRRGFCGPATPRATLSTDSWSSGRFSERAAASRFAAPDGL